MFSIPRIAFAALTIVVVAAVAVTAVDIPTKKVDGSIKWVYGYKEGKKLSRKTGKPMFVVFRCER